MYTIRFSFLLQKKKLKALRGGATPVSSGASEQ
jgi:hypothetical protein